jgi:hypothetical protein
MSPATKKWRNALSLSLFSMTYDVASIGLFWPHSPRNPTFYVVLSPQRKEAMSALWVVSTSLKLVNEP